MYPRPLGPAALAIFCLCLVVPDRVAAQPANSRRQEPASPRTGSQPLNELDAFMEKVLARRELNRKTLDLYVLDEAEAFEILGPGRMPLHRTKRDFTWYVRDGMHVRSPVRFNGVGVGEEARNRYEEDWIRRERERQERKAKGQKEQKEITVGSEGIDVSSTVVPTEPRFVSEAYFMDFKFEPGNYYLAGREGLEGHEVLKIEYYPTGMFGDNSQTDEAGEKRGQRARRAERQPGEHQVEQDIERKMNKTALITLWVDPAEHQVVKYTFDNVWMDFLPGGWLVRVDDIRAAMTMGQPFPGVWLPRGLNVHAGVTLASGSFEAAYGRTFSEYRLAEVATKIRIPKRSAVDAPGASHRHVRRATCCVQGAPVRRADVLGPPVPRADVLGAPVPRADVLGAPVPRADVLGAPVPRADVLGAPVPHADVPRALVPHADVRQETIEGRAVLLVSGPAGRTSYGARSTWHASLSHVSLSHVSPSHASPSHASTRHVSTSHGSTPHVAHSTSHVSQSPEVVREVRIHGNAVLSDEEVLAIAGVAVDQPLAAGGADEIARRLKESRRFETVEVRKRYRSLTNASDVALVLVVHERPGVRAGVAGTPASLPGPVGRLRRKMMFLPIVSFADGYGFTYGGRMSTVDLLGGGERLSVPLTWGGTRRAAFEFERVFKTGPLTRIDSSLAVWSRENPRFEIRDRRVEVRGRAERVFRDVIRVGADASQGAISFGQIDDRHWTIGASVAFDTRLDPAFPGNAVLLGAGWTGLHFREIVEPVNRYVGDARGYLRVYRQAVVAGRVQYTAADAALPPYERLLLGGSSSVRGFRTGTFDGDRMLVTSAEIRVPVTSVLRGAKLGFTAFVDAGKIWDFDGSMRAAEWHRGAGGGMFIIASLFRVNLDVARGLKNGETRVHLSSGFTF